MNAKNNRHPEQRPGEVFLANAAKTGFDLIGWKTRRMGIQAIDVVPARGCEAEEHFPVFVQQAEIEADKDGQATLKRLGVDATDR